jgi:raffinose/stachyose/melibiose transport system substrate-binding protein
MSDEQCVGRRELLQQAGRIAGAGVALPYVFSLTGNQPALAYHRASSSALPKFQGQISFYAQAYTPQHATKSNPHPPTKFFEVAARYEKMHPNIKIKFLPTNLGGTNYPGWVTTEAAGGTLPDITWNQWGQVNTGYYPKGIYVNLKPYLLRPNPYVPGNKRWIDLFNPRIMQEITSPLDGGIYAVDGDYVGTAIYYVRDHFQKIGVKKLPHTWKDFMAIHEQLKRHGFTPFGFDLSSDGLLPAWWDRKMLVAFFEPRLSEFDVDHNQYYATILDYAVGVKKGLFSMKNPAFQEVWKLLKDWSRYWAPGATTINMNAPGQVTSGVSAVQLFMQGKVSMLWDGTWLIPTLDALGFKGQYGVFTLPIVTKETTPFSNNINYQGVVGGPNAAFQYFVASPHADHTMTPARLAWCIDWLQYISTPDNAGSIINDLGAFIPTVKGARVVSSTVRSLIPTWRVPTSIEGPFSAAPTPQSLSQGVRLLQEYIQGSVDWSGFSSEFESIIQQSVDQWAAKNHVDLNKYLK